MAMAPYERAAAHGRPAGCCTHELEAWSPKTALREFERSGSLILTLRAKLDAVLPAENR